VCIYYRYIHPCGPGSSVGIAPGYGLDGPGIESRWGARFSAPVQTGPGAHPASCTMGTGFFPGVKRHQGVTLTPHPLLVPWSWKSRAIPLLPLWAVRPVQSLSACIRVTFTFYIHPYKVKFSLHLSTALCTRARLLAVTLDLFLLISADGSEWSSPSSARFIPGERAFGIRWTGDGRRVATDLVWWRQGPISVCLE